MVNSVLMVSFIETIISWLLFILYPLYRLIERILVRENVLRKRVVVAARSLYILKHSVNKGGSRVKSKR